ncbi:precorrin-6x reductase [Methylocella silvestris BL2]|uniref:Precorrin-6x reductase n=1 Tax=Methylocella silvestris (strain DSM 15510 / CIP 108128 / LMG 27833 / NCIMB 13906 / BL2) TaxID=395965 RepID=B8EQF7_METSB|nr:cobalt-precorrin-6A reductase [Methylocella silvestris]ACK52170.1 precorrin-6x reductase [Methylocella silvestris BL2]
MRVLILGGTAEASALAALLAGLPDIAPILSLAGRTAAPVKAPIPMRIGGFGGAAGLARYIAEECVDLLVDATHPFAAEISRNAASAASARTIPLVVVGRPPWIAQPGDRWIAAGDMAEAAALLGATRRRVFLAIGRLQLAAFEAAPQHFYLIRGIEPISPKLPDYRFISARGPFEAEAERRLLKQERIDIVVAKNSGSQSVYGKIEAARELGLPVVMVERPPQQVEVKTPAEALDLILRHRAIHEAALAPRGV